MTVKRYRLTAEGKSSGFPLKGEFKFRVSHEKSVEGRKIIFSQKNSPVITMGINHVISTENVTAQDRIEVFKIPNTTFRNGVRRNPNWTHFFFENVTGITNEQDVDLDLDVTYFS
ncbi:MAG: hypothetical protein GF334_05985 [Candidatus Altiarchaeales archaeon]|nr:hypothetical protein [Candidatus Altiarchaeales archaeon]